MKNKANGICIFDKKGWAVHDWRNYKERNSQVLPVKIWKPFPDKKFYKPLGTDNFITTSKTYPCKLETLQMNISDNYNFVLLINFPQKLKLAKTHGILITLFCISLFLLRYKTGSSHYKAKRTIALQQIIGANTLNLA